MTMPKLDRGRRRGPDGDPGSANVKEDLVDEFAVPLAVVEVAAEVDELAEAVRVIVGRSPTWTDTSPARQQVDVESTYAGPSSPHPMKHALLTGTSALGMCTDHLTALAACLRTERTVYAPLSLIRPVLSSSGMAHYLLRADLPVLERLRRSWSMHTAAYTEQLALSRRPGDEIERASLARRQEIRDLAEAAGFEVNHPEWKRLKQNSSPTPPKWKIGSAAFPGEGSLIAETLSLGADGGRLGWTIYRMTSMFVHAQPIALTMMRLDQVGSDEPGVATVRLGTSLDRTLSLLAPAALSVRASATSAVELFGHDPTWWNVRLPAILRRWQTIVEAHVDRPVEPFDVQPGDVARAVGLLLPGS
jgi:hypothetical protein